MRRLRNNPMVNSTFERSKHDLEAKGVKEGSKSDKSKDKKQLKSMLKSKR